MRISMKSLLNDLRDAINRPKLTSTPTYLQPSPSPTHYASKPLTKKTKVQYSKAKRPTQYHI